MNMTPVTGDFDPCRRVLLLYFLGYHINPHAEMLGEKTATVQSLAAACLFEKGQSHHIVIVKMLSCDSMQFYRPL